MHVSHNPYHPYVPSQLFPEYQLPCSQQKPTAQSTTTDSNKQKRQYEVRPIASTPNHENFEMGIQIPQT